MHRQPLLKLLELYAKRYAGELVVVERIRSLVERSPACFLRSCRPGHVTGSAWVMSADRQRCLLVHHAKLDRWLQPGGHAEGECDISQVALREVREETGLTELLLPKCDSELVPLDLDVHPIPARYSADGSLLEDAHEHHDVRFLVVATGDQNLAVSAESHDLGWFTADEVRALTSEESVLRMLRKAGPE